MSWADIEDATHKAICLASGFSANQVMWSYQDYNAPTLDYIVLTFGGEIAIGQDWIRITQNLNRPSGQEIKLDIRGVREVPLQIEVFTSDVYGNDAARRVAEVVRTKLRLDGVRHGLRKAGLSPFDTDPVQWIPDIPTARFRGRAVFTARCYVPVMDCYEYVGYIARVRGTIYPMVATGIPINWYGASGIAFDTSGVSGYTSYNSTVYYGGSAVGTYNAAFITALANTAQRSSKAGEYAIAAGSALYSFWAAPTSFGAIADHFYDDETQLSAGMSLAATGVSVGGVSYDLWKSDTAGLGTWTLEVT